MKSVGMLTSYSSDTSLDFAPGSFALHNVNMPSPTNSDVSSSSITTSNTVSLCHSKKDFALNGARYADPCHDKRGRTVLHSKQWQIGFLDGFDGP